MSWHVGHNEVICEKNTLKRILGLFEFARRSIAINGQLGGLKYYAWYQHLAS